MKLDNPNRIPRLSFEVTGEQVYEVVLALVAEASTSNFERLAA